MAVAVMGPPQQALVDRTGAVPDPLNQRGLCLLSLDGGGVRGLSTLYILKGIMTRLNNARQHNDLSTVKPCEIFDLIGGTSTGGLIAIMLGRLEMDVDDCITAYRQLSEQVFAKKSRKLPFGLSGKVKARFDSQKLEDAIKDVVTKGGNLETALFNDDKERGCKVFVCATADETKRTTRLRSYTIEGEAKTTASICEAALATSAATSFFEPVTIGARKFVDGGLGANNPVDEVESEASNIWSPQKGDLKPLVKCFISIGTGHPGKKAIEKSMAKFLAKTLVSIATETEATAEKFVQRWRKHYDDKRYFRFNVEQGLQGVGLEEYKEEGTIQASTEEYLEEQGQKFRLRDCVSNLEQKQNTASKYLQDEIHTFTESQTFQRFEKRFIGRAGWTVPWGKNGDFVGRNTELQQVDEALSPSDRCAKVALFGLGGVGKTQIALEYAYRAKAQDPDRSVFWIQATSSEAVQQGFIEIGEQLKLLEPDSHSKDILALVQQHLNSKRAGRWLLIIDNADDSDMWFPKPGNQAGSTRLFDYLPNSSHGCILITTRDRKLAVNMVGKSIIKVKHMDHDTAEELLRKTLIVELLDDQRTITELLTQLDFLPLAIKQAASYINCNNTTLSEYLSLLDQKTKKEQEIVMALSEHFEHEGRYSNSTNAVVRTWLISFEQIKLQNPLAIEYLQFMSCLNPKNIPKSVLPSDEPEFKIRSAFGTLDAYSFITKLPHMEEQADEYFDMHRLVHLATRNWLREQALFEQQSEVVLRRMADVFPQRDHHDRPRWRVYLPHGLYVLGMNGHWDERSDVETLKNRVGLCLLEDGRYSEAEGWLRQVWTTRRIELGQEHPSTLTSITNLALTY